MTYLELINLNNVFLLQSKKLRRKIVEAKKKKVNGGQKGVSENSIALTSIVGKGTGTQEDLDLANIKKKLEDYEQMLQYYTWLRMKNKMDSEAEFEKQWEVSKEYFTREFEKNLAHHRVNERILRYKLEAYQKNFPIFNFGNPTNIEVLG